MDTGDASGIKQFIQSLDAQKAILKAAMAREGQLPKTERLEMNLLTSTK
jgi:hypothetical protein